MCANKGLIVNRIICVRLKCLKPFSCMLKKMSSGSSKKCVYNSYS